MSKLVVFENVTLDGVAQAPARPDEDRRGGFQHGGWGAPYMDAVAARVAGQAMSRPGVLLLGRKTYEDFYEIWPKRTDGNPYTEKLNKVQKFVASRTLREPLPWMNSTLLKGDLPQAVAQLKKQQTGDVGVIGSIRLVHELARHNLVDIYVVQITPLVLGGGLRLFPEGVANRLRLVDSITTTTGVIIATYEPVRPAAQAPPVEAAELALA
ncbi:MAG TPA: dihydrofolate reductase family protein [Chloroflexota bacterium]|nr:dihydrofolate reductase family protein [Chloroflexota bacterium]